MGRKAGWILGAVLAVALYATPAAAQVSVSVGIGVPPVAAGVVIGGPVPVYPAYPPYYYYPYGYYPYPVYGRACTTPRATTTVLAGPITIAAGRIITAERATTVDSATTTVRHTGVTVQRIEAPARCIGATSKCPRAVTVATRDTAANGALLAATRLIGRRRLVRHFDQPIAAAHVLFHEVEQRFGDRSRLSVADRLPIPLDDRRHLH